MANHKIIVKQKGKLFTSNTEYLTETEELIKKYWGNDLTQERFFVIPFWELWENFEKYNRTDKVALRVKNIDTPSEVSAEWIRVLPENTDLSERAASFSATEFVITKQEFLGDPMPPIDPPTPEDTKFSKGGMIQALVKGYNDKQWRKSIVIARLGKENNGETVCIFQFIDSTKLMIKPPSGNGAGLGLKIPPPGSSGG
ncbi:MAG: hypothetical protein AB8G22_17775 [Saprospiraceae bacterium]